MISSPSIKSRPIKRATTAFSLLHFFRAGTAAPAASFTGAGILTQLRGSSLAEEWDNGAPAFARAHPMQTALNLKK
jgi:hypothetical protein